MYTFSRFFIFCLLAVLTFSCVDDEGLVDPNPPTPPVTTNPVDDNDTFDNDTTDVVVSDSIPDSQDTTIIDTSTVIVIDSFPPFDSIITTVCNDISLLDVIYKVIDSESKIYSLEATYIQTAYHMQADLSFVWNVNGQQYTGNPIELDLNSYTGSESTLYPVVNAFDNSVMSGAPCYTKYDTIHIEFPNDTICEDVEVIGVNHGFTDEENKIYSLSAVVATNDLNKNLSFEWNVGGAKYNGNPIELDLSNFAQESITLYSKVDARDNDSNGNTDCYFSRWDTIEVQFPLFDDCSKVLDYLTMNISPANNSYGSYQIEEDTFRFHGYAENNIDYIELSVGSIGTLHGSISLELTYPVSESPTDASIWFYGSKNNGQCQDTIYSPSFDFTDNSRSVTVEKDFYLHNQTGKEMRSYQTLIINGISSIPSYEEIFSLTFYVIESSTGYVVKTIKHVGFRDEALFININDLKEGDYIIKYDHVGYYPNMIEHNNIEYGRFTL